MSATQKSRFQTAATLADVPAECRGNAVRFHTAGFALGRDKRLGEVIVRFRVHGGKFVEIAMTRGLALLLAAELGGCREACACSKLQVEGAKAESSKSQVTSGKLRAEGVAS